MRWTSILLAVLLLTLFLPASEARPDILVDDGTCFGVNPGNLEYPAAVQGLLEDLEEPPTNIEDPPEIPDSFTGYCWKAWPCICPNMCQHWYIHGIYVFQLC